MASRDVEYSSQYDTYPSAEHPPNWQARRLKVLKRNGFRCQSCGIRSTRVDDVWFDIDHIVPKSEGGGHELGNLQTLCPPCHSTKHPQNTSLSHRGRQFTRRNKPSVFARVFWLFLGVFISSSRTDEETIIDERGRRLHPRTLSDAAALPEDTGVTVEVTVTALWHSSSDSVQHLGRVQDATVRHSQADETETTPARFVVWNGHDHPTVREGTEYRFVGAKTSRYNGDFQLVVDAKSAVQVL